MGLILAKLELAYSSTYIHFGNTRRIRFSSLHYLLNFVELLSPGYNSFRLPKSRKRLSQSLISIHIFQALYLWLLPSTGSADMD